MSKHDHISRVHVWLIIISVLGLLLIGGACAYYSIQKLIEDIQAAGFALVPAGSVLAVCNTTVSRERNPYVVSHDLVFQRVFNPGVVGNRTIYESIYGAWFWPRVPHRINHRNAGWQIALNRSLQNILPLADEDRALARSGEVADQIVAIKSISHSEVNRTLSGKSEPHFLSSATTIVLRNRNGSSDVSLPRVEDLSHRSRGKLNPFVTWSVVNDGRRDISLLMDQRYSWLRVPGFSEHITKNDQAKQQQTGAEKNSPAAAMLFWADPTPAARTELRVRAEGASANRTIARAGIHSGDTLRPAGTPVKWRFA